MPFQSIPELSVDAKKLLGQECKEILSDKCPRTQKGQKLQIPSLTLLMLEGWKLAKGGTHFGGLTCLNQKTILARYTN